MQPPLAAASFRLDGKTALVTGAGSGLGRECAVGLSAFGAHVICADRDQAWLCETVGLIENMGGQVSPLVFDGTSETEVRNAASVVEASHGAIHILVNNAGVAQDPALPHNIEFTE
jgi:NAD(P)-dependent dehydrogenase (short-subunit alcohol dehydrogenase family)